MASNEILPENVESQGSQSHRFSSADHFSPKSASRNDSPRSLSPTTGIGSADAMLSDPEDAHHCETTPLLRHADAPPRYGTPRFRTSTYVFILTLLLVLLLDLSNDVQKTPQTEIFEGIICRRFYRDGNHALSDPGTSLKGYDCKVEPVQSELALVNGWLDTFAMLPGIILGLPYGVLADRIGRKPVLFLSLVGIWFSEIFIKIICWFPNVFPLRLVWLTQLVQILGGGSAAASSMVYVLLTDAVDEEDRANAYMKMAAFILLSEMIATPAGAAMMSINPWIPFLASPILFIIGMLLTLALPETLKLAVASTRASSILSSEQLERERAEEGLLKSRIISLSRKFVNSTQFIWQNVNVMLLLFVFFVGSLGKQSSGLLLQYASKKFGWSLAKASMLISVRAGVQLGLLLFILPVIANIMVHRFKLSPAAKDLRIIQGSTLLFLVGSALLGIAPNMPTLIVALVIIGLGSGMLVILRSLIASFVLPIHVATLFSAASVVQCGGLFVAGPLLANTFKWGLTLDDRHRRLNPGDPFVATGEEKSTVWLGLPFLFASMLYCMAFMAVALVRLPRPVSFVPVGEAIVHDDDEAN